MRRMWSRREGPASSVRMNSSQRSGGMTLSLPRLFSRRMVSWTSRCSGKPSGRPAAVP